MTLSIHQPQYIPWIPYFSKIYHSDIFVLLDHVQFQKNGLQNRNYIFNKKEEIRLTLPVHVHLGNSIKDVTISQQNILSKHWTSIELAYKKAPFFHEVSEFLFIIYSNSYSLLCELNCDLINAILNYLGIKTKMLRSSEMNVTGEKSGLILNICQQLHADRYLTGTGGLDYLQKEDFEKEKIEIQLLEYPKKKYVQANAQDHFIENLSILDLLFNTGKKAINYL